MLIDNLIDLILKCTDDVQLSIVREKISSVETQNYYLENPLSLEEVQTVVDDTLLTITSSPNHSELSDLFLNSLPVLEYTLCGKLNELSVCDYITERVAQYREILSK